MTDFFKNNPIALRHCILFDVLQQTPIEKAYSKFCKTIGNDFMEYREFDNWYYRFINEEYDLSYEIDKDKKIHELSDMPIDVLGKIVENLDIFDRLALSKTSRSFRTFIEDQKLFQQTLTLDADLHVVSIEFDEKTEIEYKAKEEDCIKRFVKPGKLIQEQDPWKEALKDFKSILKNPKLHLDFLKINWFSDKQDYYKPRPLFCLLIQELKNAMKFPHQLNVRKLSIDYYDYMPLLSILPLFTPGYLTDIHVDVGAPEEDLLEEIANLEQWKQAKTFNQDGFPFNSSLRHFYHFKEFTVFLETFPLVEVRKMKEILFKSPNFEKCSVLVAGDTGAKAVRAEFGEYIQQEEDSSEDTEIYHYPIPDSNEYCEIKILEEVDIHVTRKKI